MAETLLGAGVLTWNANERRSDRYGTVYLIAEGENSYSTRPCPSLISRAAAMSINRRVGALIADVTATRDSTHIGDLFRGVKPRTPRVGDRIVLGAGMAFFAELTEGGVKVGVYPEDGRTTNLLDIRALYDAHEQSVRLLFVEGGRG